MFYLEEEFDCDHALVGKIKVFLFCKSLKNEYKGIKLTSSAMHCRCAREIFVSLIAHSIAHSIAHFGQGKSFFVHLSSIKIKISSVLSCITSRGFDGFS